MKGKARHGTHRRGEERSGDFRTRLLTLTLTLIANPNPNKELGLLYFFFNGRIGDACEDPWYVTCAGISPMILFRQNFLTVQVNYARLPFRRRRFLYHMYICSTLYNEKTCRHILVNLSLVEVRVKKAIRRAWREHGVASGTPSSCR